MTRADRVHSTPLTNASAIPRAEDIALVRALSDLRATDQTISEFRKYVGQKLWDLEQRRNENIATLIIVPASSASGLQAKAAALQEHRMIEDYDQHQQIAGSLADDLLGRPKRLKIADNASLAPGRFKGQAPMKRQRGSSESDR